MTTNAIEKLHNLDVSTKAVGREHETIVDYDITLPSVEEDILEYDITLSEEEMLDYDVDITDENIVEYDIDLEELAEEAKLPSLESALNSNHYLPPLSKK